MLIFWGRSLHVNLGIASCAWGPLPFFPHNRPSGSQLASDLLTVVALFSLEPRGKRYMGLVLLFRTDELYPPTNATEAAESVGGRWWPRAFRLAREQVHRSHSEVKDRQVRPRQFRSLGLRVSRAKRHIENLAAREYRDGLVDSCSCTSRQSHVCRVQHQAQYCRQTLSLVAPAHVGPQCR